MGKAGLTEILNMLCMSNNKQNPEWINQKQIYSKGLNYQKKAYEASHLGKQSSTMASSLKQKKHEKNIAVKSSPFSNR